MLWEIFLYVALSRVTTPEGLKILDDTEGARKRFSVISGHVSPSYPNLMTKVLTNYKYIASINLLCSIQEASKEISPITNLS